MDRKNYVSYTIPKREDLTKAQTVYTSLEYAKNASTSEEQFAEIELLPSTPNFDVNTDLPSENVTLSADNKRTKFYSMRQIARENLAYQPDNSRVFYLQAKFMEDFEDDYDEHEPFSSYFPYYQQMGYEQLRTYFTWRTQVRQGNVAYTSVSYAFLYIYELLNNIGVTDPQDGLNKLMAFWQDFRAYDSVIDKYLLQWVKDYHVYYPLTQTFEEFATQNELQRFYPTVFGYKCGEEDSFDLFEGISRYSITKSAYYNEKTRDMFIKCFFFILNRLRILCNKKEVTFEDLVFYPIEGTSTWTPFDRALFYPALEQRGRQVFISDREIYLCQESNFWIYKSVILTESGKQLISYIMKEMEANLREITGYKHKLSTNTYLRDRELKKKLTSLEIPLPKLIKQSVSEFYSIYTRKKITVNVGSLKQIRQEAQYTQERLIVPEELDMEEKTKQQAVENPAVQVESPAIKVENPATLAERPATQVESPTAQAERPATQLESPTAQAESPAAQVESPTAQAERPATQVEISEVQLDIPAVGASDIWTAFKNALSQLEIEALKLIIKDSDIKSFASQNRVMLEVLIDGINQKATDYIGDTVLELDDTVIIYDEYRDIIKDKVI